MAFSELATRFALAFGIGLLIGLERGWQLRQSASGQRAAGIRTFALSGLLGGVASALGQAVGGSTSIGSGIIIGMAFAIVFRGRVGLLFRGQS